MIRSTTNLAAAGLVSGNDVRKRIVSCVVTTASCLGEEVSFCMAVADRVERVGMLTLKTLGILVLCLPLLVLPSVEARFEHLVQAVYAATGSFGRPM